VYHAVVVTPEASEYIRAEASRQDDGSTYYETTYNISYVGERTALEGSGVWLQICILSLCLDLVKCLVSPYKFALST
jgi:hypothetical protein